MIELPASLFALMLLANGWLNRMWYALPLIVVISLVYAATRHEVMKPILDHALRFGLWVATFMFIVFGVLMLVTSWL